MVHGYCIYGGFNLAIAMDIIFASEDALFLWGGLLGAGRALWDLGLRKSLELTLEHRFLTAREAYEYHMVNRVFADRETLEKETLAFAERITLEAVTRVRRAKQDLLALMDYQGFTAGQEAVRTPFAQTWRDWAADSRIRYEGKGIARTPVALQNLKAKLESEGKEVPENVEAAIRRAAERDDRAKWQEALHQKWRDPKRVARAEAQYDAFLEQEKAKQAKK
jgi:enoyl-CoA hydratase/carnithine racemase